MTHTLKIVMVFAKQNVPEVWHRLFNPNLYADYENWYWIGNVKPLEHFFLAKPVNFWSVNLYLYLKTSPFFERCTMLLNLTLTMIYLSSFQFKIRVAKCAAIRLYTPPEAPRIFKFLGKGIFFIALHSSEIRSLRST